MGWQVGIYLITTIFGYGHKKKHMLTYLSEEFWQFEDTDGEGLRKPSAVVEITGSFAAAVTNSVITADTEAMDDVVKLISWHRGSHKESESCSIRMPLKYCEKTEPAISMTRQILISVENLRSDTKHSNCQIADTASITVYSTTVADSCKSHPQAAKNRSSKFTNNIEVLSIWVTQGSIANLMYIITVIDESAAVPLWNGYNVAKTIIA